MGNNIRLQWMYTVNTDYMQWATLWRHPWSPSFGKYDKAIIGTYCHYRLPSGGQHYKASTTSVMCLSPMVILSEKELFSNDKCKPSTTDHPQWPSTIKQEGVTNDITTGQPELQHYRTTRSANRYHWKLLVGQHYKATTSAVHAIHTG